MKLKTNNIENEFKKLLNNKFYTNKFFDGTSQTLSRNFPIPKTHKLLMSFNRIGTEKYVTKIYKKV